jgi:hypothetical protein
MEIAIIIGPAIHQKKIIRVKGNKLSDKLGEMCDLCTIEYTKKMIQPCGP